MVPLTDHSRCLKHAGPAAARRYREQQIRELAAGRLEPAVFAEAERRRAVNRLRWTWKKDPWFPGVTLDLGVHEDAFQQALAAFGWHLDGMPPAVVDWARWRFRRLMVDRQRPGEWAELASELRTRIEAAGDAPDEPRNVAGITPAFSTPDRMPVYSRRRSLDLQQQSGCIVQTPRGPVLASSDVGDISPILVQYHRELAPILARCEADKDRARVVAAFRQLIAEPDNPAAYLGWIATLRMVL